MVSIEAFVIEARVLAALLMGILCFGDSELGTEIRVDVITDGGGYAGSVIALKTEDGYLLRDKREGMEVQHGFLADRGDGIFSLYPETDDSDNAYSLSDLIVDLDKLDLRSARTATLQCRGEDGIVELKMDRSGDVIYLREAEGDITLSIHAAKAPADEGAGDTQTPVVQQAQPAPAPVGEAGDED